VPERRPILPLWAAVAAAVAGGLLLTTAYPSLGWWPMAFVAVPSVLVSLAGRRSWSALLVGFAFGAAFSLTNLAFTARYLGPVPWLALSILEALIIAVGSIPIALAYRWLPRVLPGRWATLVGLPALVAALWTMRELVQGTFPYGGFPWARIGVTQSDAPDADIASWVGMSGLSFLVVFACAAAIEYVRERRFGDLRGAVPAALALVVLFVVPQFPTTASGTLRVGAVQGNGPAGYFDDHTADAILNAQLQATAPIADERMDVMVWPEGAVDSDPTRNDVTAAVLDGLVERIGAPLVVGAITQGTGERSGEYFNSSLLWAPDAANPVQSYDKRHPVPFGEYVPDRWLWRTFAPDLIDLIQREYTPGTKPPVFDIQANGARVGIGLAICFDVIYDDVVRDGALGGAQVYFFQTNNADFRGTSENLQQLAFARMRAIETGRSVVNISTVGTSQVIAPDGSEIAGLDADVAGHLLTDVPLRTGLTPAVIAGPWIQSVLGWGSVVVVAALGILVAVRRRREKTPTRSGSTSSDDVAG
jgi:apolipoprotein N-acyltransferase